MPGFLIHYLNLSYFQSSVLNGLTGKPSLLNRFDMAMLVNEKRTATGFGTALLETIILSFQFLQPLPAQNYDPRLLL